jgi:hypothetical protein
MTIGTSLNTPWRRCNIGELCLSWAPGRWRSVPPFALNQNILTAGSGRSASMRRRRGGDAAAVHHRSRTCTTWSSINSWACWQTAPAAPDRPAGTPAREAQARQRPRAVSPTVLFEYCVCIQYDADPDRRVANPTQTILVGGHLAPDLIRLSGGVPLFMQPGDPARWVAFEEIAQAPDVICSMVSRLSDSQEAAIHPPRWSGLKQSARATYPLNHL